MKIQSLMVSFLSMISLLFSTSIFAHPGHHEPGLYQSLYHLMTHGDHLFYFLGFLLAAVIMIGYLVKKRSKSKQTVRFN